MRTTSRSRVLAGFALLLTVAACESPTDLDPVSGIEPSMAISDAKHDGTPGFFFLRPMVQSPRPFTGKFDRTLSPVVRICHWVNDACEGSDIVIDRTGNGAATLKVKDRSYAAEWEDTDDLLLGETYRLRVYLDDAATTPLGFADLMVVAKRRHRSGVPAGFIGIARGYDFDIRFRIEQGTTTPGGGTDPDPDEAPAVVSTLPADGATGVTPSANISIAFSEAVTVTGDWFEIDCTLSGTRSPAQTSVSGGPLTFTINPNDNFAVGETCEVTIVAAQVVDQDGDDPPDNLDADYVFDFSTVSTLAPAPVDDGPASNSVPGDPFHAFVDVPIIIPPPGLLDNDEKGIPAGQISSFGGGSLGGSVTAFPAGETVMFGLNGELTVNANGGIAFRPSSGFTGAFTFQYRVTNSVGSGDATVTIFVGPR